jgi:hypothetical protein
MDIASIITVAISVLTVLFGAGWLGKGLGYASGVKNAIDVLIEAAKDGVITSEELAQILDAIKNIGK